MDPYLWPQPSHQDPGPNAEHLQATQGLLQSNGTTRTTQSHQSPNGGWSADFGYVNGRLNPQAVQQAIPQQMYDSSWGAYGIYNDFDAAASLGIDPSALMTQPTRSTSGVSQSISESPATIDPNLMMKSTSSSLPHYISPTQTQLNPANHSQLDQAYTQHGYSSVYPLSSSSLSAVMDYPGPPATPSSSAATPTQLLEPNGLNGDSDPLINQVKQILAPKKLDQDPQGTATKLFELILPPSSEDGSATITITVDRDTRMEILNRIRDYAPKEFWNQFAKNLRALALLREWGRQASKKEEFADTMMGWLQVVDKLPLTVDVLIQSQLGKIVKYIVDHAPTKATTDMASRIKTNWEQLAAAPQTDSINTVKTAKKRKDEGSLKAATTPSTTTPASSNPPPSKKPAVSTAAGTKPVRRDSVSSVTTTATAGGNVTNAAASTSAAAAPVKGAQSDSSFFSAKPKAKLPSFRKKPTGTTGATSGTGGGTGGGATAGAVVKEESSAQPPVDPNYNPFTDALRAMRKGSPQVASSSTTSNSSANGGGQQGPSISAKTGKPKKVVRFAVEGELEKIKWIEKAIYDDDVPGRPKGFHGSYRDLDRFEGNLLRHMVAQIEWYEPPLIVIPDEIQVTTRGEFSQESKAQEEREASTLAAIYQVAPPDTPVEPPQLASMSLVADDSSAKSLLLGSQIEELLQARQDDMQNASATHWLGQLSSGILDGSLGTTAANLYPEGGGGQNAPGGQEGIAELLSKLMQSMPQSGAGQQPTPYGSAPLPPQYGMPPQTTADPAAAALLSVLSSALVGGAPATAAGYGTYGLGGDPFGGAGAGAGGASSSAYAAGTTATSGLPPPLHSGMPTGHDEEEERWRRSSKVDAKKTKGKQVPASQNTWRTLCTYFARGRCRFGENCDFSHDPAKLAQGS